MPEVSKSTTMRAIQYTQFGGPEVLKLVTNAPVPQSLGAHDVLVRMVAAGINPVDAYIRSGTFYGPKKELPHTPGLDGAGVVAQIGAAVTRFKVNDRVYITQGPSGETGGTYAEYCRVNERYVFNLPANLTYLQGAALGLPYFTAYRALFQKCYARPGESVLIHGASGAVGLAACQLARAYGLTVYGTAGSDSGLKLVRENGAHHVFNHRSNGYIEQISGSGKKIDIIIEMLANVNLANDLSMLAQYGRVAVVGSRGTVEINPRGLMQTEAMVVGIASSFVSDADARQTAAAIEAGVEKGWLRPVVDREYTLAEAEQAHKDVMSNSAGAKGKLVLKIASQ